MSKSYSIGVLTSGYSRGSNLAAMAKYFLDNLLPVHISFAIKTRIDAPMTDICAKFNINCLYIPIKNMVTFENMVLDLCREYRIDLLALSGFLKLLSRDFLQNLGIPVLNIHPALLPDYGGKGMYGMAVHEAVFKAGEKVSGATVHLVDPQYDHGKIIAQEKVDISECSSPVEIANAVLKIEHQLYGKAIWEVLQKYKKK